MNSNRKSSRYSIAPITRRPGEKSMPAPILRSLLKRSFSAGHGVHRSFSALGALGRCVRLFHGFLQGILRPTGDPLSPLDIGSAQRLLSDINMLDRSRPSTDATLGQTCREATAGSGCTFGGSDLSPARSCAARCPYA